MRLAELLLQDFDIEMRNTRTTLERIPNVSPTYKPHDKSMPCGRLAVHVATLCRLGTTILTTDALDMATQKWPAIVFESREKLLADFDEASSELRGHLEAATEDQLEQRWRFSFGEKVLANEPRSKLYRTMFFNHLIHHRAQLGVYLRMNDEPVPALYGPSADDTMGF
jgi:uncharacterized damage-inducible protein DinB